MVAPFSIMNACMWIHSWQINLSDDQICGIDRHGRGTYTIEGISALANALSVNASVTSVSLLRNGFNTEAVAMLLKVKEDHPKLKTLCGFSHEEEELDLNGFGKTKLGPADAMLIAPELGVMASITQVCQIRQVLVCGAD